MFLLDPQVKNLLIHDPMSFIVSSLSFEERCHINKDIINSIIMIAQLCQIFTEMWVIQRLLSSLCAV